ncbi:N-6 DNA Methylase [Desulfonatronum zhilinae]|nr:N-6 DNA Methylase [Desulfonatronum zhilinae]
MNDALITQIQNFTLQARAVLEAEAAQQLEGIYGWLPDGRFADEGSYPALGELQEARETRTRLEAYASEEKGAGVGPKDARSRLAREIAFTWLNRLVALRMMEERRLIKPTVARLDKSNSFIFWLTADGNEERYARHQQGGLPRNAMGEGPSDEVYRFFLLEECARLAGDVSVLFDPRNLPSRLFPRPLALKTIVESMNQEGIKDAWQAGNEETIGWVYQAFNAEELQAAFTAARLTKKKFEAGDIPSVTQLFTIRWVVTFLVHNSLGRLWLEMHPDSRLRDSLTYLVPSQHSARPIKPVRQITFLDPSCGSMHFGLVAFDLLVEMYKEEMDMAGRPGWPERASVASVDDIPASIVANNIHGLDIDLRAVQLSALALFLKARTMNPTCVFTDRNLACANVEAVTGGRLDAFIAESHFSSPIYERVLRAVAASLKDSDQLGSLLRLEKTLDALIAEERGRLNARKQHGFFFPGISEVQFTTAQGVQEFFEVLHIQITRHLDNFVRESRGMDNEPAHFATETAKGLRFLGLVSQKYDVVATNPPYLSGRKMNNRLADLLKVNYPEGKSDLYAAFILRCQELTQSQGFLGMLTMHSFMFISSYQNLRETLRQHVCVETLAHFGGGLFSVGNPGTLQTAAFILRKEENEQQRLEHQGVYFRLVREKNSEAKRIAFENELNILHSNYSDRLAYTVGQESFDEIPGKPWSYWTGDFVRGLFRKLEVLGKSTPPRVGLQTGENARFLRKWWEVGLQRVEQKATSCTQSKSTGKKWFPYMKGGSPKPWFGNQEHVVNWYNNGSEIDAFRPRAVIRNPNYYFSIGITWSDVSSSGFAGRISPGGFIHDVKGMTCYPQEREIYAILGLFNSTLAKFILNALNPTISFQVGDIERLPIPDSVSEPLDVKVQQAIALARQDSADKETTYDFLQPPFSVGQVDERHARLRTVEEEIDREVTRLYGLTEEDRLALKAELEGGAAVAEAEDDAGEGDDGADIESAWTDSGLGRAWISYALGAVLGRYAIGEPDGLGRGEFGEPTAAAIRALVDEDGIMASEPGHPQDITARTFACLQLMRGQEAACEIIRSATGSAAAPEEALRAYLDRFTGTPEVSFWRHHLQLYRKRPIYWPLQSPRRTLTVWVFQGRFTTDTLFKVRSTFVDPKVRWLDARIRELRFKAEAGSGTEKRRAEKDASLLADQLDDVQEFSTRINAAIQRGYVPRIDDGVLLNAAPLWELLPSWQDTKKAWAELEEGKYDWAHQAMDHWPDRVREKCETDKSYAIAHGLEQAGSA